MIYPDCSLPSPPDYSCMLVENFLIDPSNFSYRKNKVKNIFRAPIL